MDLALKITMHMKCFIALRRAVKVYNDKDRWMELVNNAMNTDSSWKKSATEYIKVYEEIVNQKG